jgi:hypothetical protein
VRKETIVTALPHIQAAAGHLVDCWDALHDAERLLGTEVSVDDLSTLAVDLDYPEDCRLITDARISEWLEEMLKERAVRGL